MTYAIGFTVALLAGLVLGWRLNSWASVEELRRSPRMRRRLRAWLDQAEGPRG